MSRSFFEETIKGKKSSKGGFKSGSNEGKDKVNQALAKALASVMFEDNITSEDVTAVLMSLAVRALTPFVYIASKSQGQEGAINDTLKTFKESLEIGLKQFESHAGSDILKKLKERLKDDN